MWPQRPHLRFYHRTKLYLYRRVRQSRPEMRLTRCQSEFHGFLSSSWSLLGFSQGNLTRWPPGYQLLMSNKPLRNYIRAFRRQCDLSQSDIAFITGWRDGRTVSNYERFKTVPSLETALMCERIFNAPVRELFAGMYSKVDHIVTKRVRVPLEESETAPDRGEKAKIRSLRSLLQEEPSVHNHED